MGRCVSRWTRRPCATWRGYSARRALKRWRSCFCIRTARQSTNCARDILLEENPDWFVTASHELSREYREYERTSTAVANAYVGPSVSAYLGELERGLRDDNRFPGDLLIMQSNGGLSDVGLARRQCIQMLESGPAGGGVGTMALWGATGGGYSR